MNPEEKALLHRVALLSEENNKMLRGLRNGQWWSRVWGFIWFIIVVAPLALSYFYLKPYLGSFDSTLKNAQSVLKTYETGNLPNQ